VARGQVQFTVKVDDNEKFPLDHVAGIMALHCFSHGLLPKDYLCVEQVSAALLVGLEPRVTALIHAGKLAGQVHLTTREKQVLGLVLVGAQNKEIAGELGLSGSTIKLYVSSLLTKFNVRSRFDLTYKISNASAYDKIIGNDGVLA